MRLITFTHGNERRTGVVVADEVVDLTDPSVGLPADLASLLAAGPGAMEAARNAPGGRARRFALEAVKLEAPVPRPPSFLAIARNYRAHAAELGSEPPAEQQWFSKQPTCVIGTGAPIWVPRVSDQVDYEGELAMVIGTRCRHVPVERALEVGAGFTVVNDVSVRDWQWRSPTMMLGKGFDTHGPMGPWVVTEDELGDPQDLTLTTRVNGDVRQHTSTADMVHGCAAMIAHLSEAFTLVPGMVLSTGTPAGVAMGEAQPRWLRAGDRVEVEIEGIGVLENPVVGEPPGAMAP